MIINSSKWSKLKHENNLLYMILLCAITKTEDLVVDAKSMKEEPLQVKLIFNGVECDLESITLSLAERIKGSLDGEYQSGYKDGTEGSIDKLFNKLRGLLEEEEEDDE